MQRAIPSANTYFSTLSELNISDNKLAESLKPHAAYGYNWESDHTGIIQLAGVLAKNKVAV
jgi:hypothetical protein